MTEEKKLTIEEAHQAFAVGLFNFTWDLLEKKDRNADDNAMMISSAHGSLYHWSRIGKPLNLQRGEWMVAHVYTILSHKEEALFHAQRCLNVTLDNKIDDFDLSFAYEGYSGALALNGSKSESDKYYKLAEKSAEDIKKKDDKDYFLSVLKEGPWFDIR
jgi:hypothetical protein